VRATPPAHSKRQVFQTETFLVLSRVDLRTKGFQPSCAQNRLAKNQNCIRLGHGRFSEVPYIQKDFKKSKTSLQVNPIRV
jgi:hypothetical protein